MSVGALSVIVTNLILTSFYRELNSPLPGQVSGKLRIEAWLGLWLGLT